VEFAKSAFGTADKPVLLAGMAVVIALVAAAGGLASRRTAGPGVAVVSALGVLGALAVLTAPTFSPLDLAAPAAALAVGVVVFRRLHALGLQARRATTPGAALSRRRVLIGTSAAVGAGAVVATGLGAWLTRDVTGSREEVTRALAGARLAERAPAIPPTAAFAESGTPFVTANADFYRIDTALRVPVLAADEWSLRLHGMVDRELTLTFDDLLARPLVERTITLLCVSNEVGGPYISTTNFIGVDLREILLEAGIRPGADQVLSTSSDGWTAGTPVDVLLEADRGALLAVGMNGEALPPEHGFPVRMVVPGLYGYVSATKWVTDLEVTTFGARQAYWLQRGWAEKAPDQDPVPDRRAGRAGAGRAGDRRRDGLVAADRDLRGGGPAGRWRLAAGRAGHRGQPRHLADVAHRVRRRARRAHRAGPGDRPERGHPDRAAPGRRPGRRHRLAHGDLRRSLIHRTRRYPPIVWGPDREEPLCTGTPPTRTPTSSGCAAWRGRSAASHG
jgi:DMSO/TMAO reductase YedYZ molybdopterin-dependent catalytic subunit